MKLKKIYFYFWSIAFIQLLIGFSFNSDSIFSINIYDTYFVADYAIVSKQISLSFFIIGLLYWIIEIANRNFNKIFYTIHFFITIGSYLCYWLTYFILSFDDPEEVFSEFGSLETITLFILFLNTIIQSIFILYFFIKLLNKKTQKPAANSGLAQ